MNISKFLLITGGMALIYCVVNIKLHCKCLCLIHKLFNAECDFLNAWASPTKSSNIRKLIIGYL